MSVETMNERLREILSEMLDLSLAEIRLDLRRSDVDAWDSLNHLRLITAVESEFGATFTMDEIAELQTPADLQRIIDERAPEHA
jgi:acyl carrier protein